MVLKDVFVHIAPELQNLITLCVGLLGIIFHDLLPPLFDVVGARLDCSFNLILTEVGTGSKLTEITARHLVTLNGKLRLFHVVGIRVRVEVPDRHVGDHRDSLHHRIVDTSIVPARIFFIHRKRTFHYASTKQGALKGSRAKMLRGMRLFKLVMDFLFHLFGCNHSRLKGNLRWSHAGTGTNFFDRLKLFLESTKTLTVVLHGLAGKQRLNTSSLLCLLHFVVSLNMDCIYHTLRERSRINSDRKLITTEEHLGHLPKGSKHFSFSNFHKNSGLLGVSKFDIRAIQTTIIAVGHNPTILLRLSCSLSLRETLFHVGDNRTCFFISVRVARGILDCKHLNAIGGDVVFFHSHFQFVLVAEGTVSDLKASSARVRVQIE